MRLYLDTSVPNFLFVDDAPDKRLHTERFFADLARGRHEVWVSELYELEVRRSADEQRRADLLEVLSRYALPFLPVTPQVHSLAQDYIAAQAFTVTHMIDSLHVATAVLGACEVVVSWNFAHIVRPWTIQRVEQVNRRLGLPPVIICTPEEVSDDSPDEVSDDS